MTATLGQLAVEFGCELSGDPEAVVHSVATLTSAGPGSISFLANPNYEKHLATTAAGAVILAPALVDDCPVASLAHPDPYHVYADVAALLHPRPALCPGVHSTAIVAENASIAATAEIAAGSFIGEGSVVGERCLVGPGAYIGRDVSLGNDCMLSPRVTILDSCRVGKRAVIQSGVVIGSEGFGFAPTSSGWRSVPQVGRVTIGDDVDIGANTTIDRGAIEDTRIGDGVKLDNLIQIAHNVQIGDHTAMAAQVGIAGSAIIGRNCMLAGHVGIVGHISICDGVVVTAKSMVTRSITEPGHYGSGLPAMPAAIYRRVIARLRQIDKLADRIGRLEKLKNK